MHFFNKRIFNKNNLPEISLIVLLDLCFLLSFFSAFYFISKKIVEILLYVAQIAAKDPLALTRSALDPYIVIPLYVYIILFVCSLSLIWIVFQGINWWITFRILNHREKFWKFLLKFLGISVVWLFFVFLTLGVTISLIVATFASQLISVKLISILAIIAILFFSYFYISTLREINNSFIQSIIQGFKKSFTREYFLKYISISLILIVFLYLAYIFMTKYFFLSILIVSFIIISLSYFRIFINLE